MDSRKDHDDHIVMGDEIARAVRCVMDGDSDIRKKVKEMSGIGRKSMLEGGSSFDSIGQFIEQKFNAFMMAKELGLVAAIESGSGKDNGGLVAAEEIARAVRHVMDDWMVIMRLGKKPWKWQKLVRSLSRKVDLHSMVKEFGLAVELRLDSRRCDGDDDHLVMADEIARAIRCVMDGDNEVRKKVKEMSVITRKSTLEGGSSFNALGLFIDMNF
ncbi:hypothetical protein LWI29_023346 [Acer saccharum]|uniref:Uncharacterized protein n=1 Tax=Acer saccharum TaxID=4024 RepID=A0AA39THA0_ACESA|nr:hypothetical protein LWI29_023346 [Acer saccharum]